MTVQRGSDRVLTCGALVLAGGRSSRLGFDKARLRIEGRVLVDWQARRLATRLSPVLVVVDRPGRFVTAAPQVVDAVAGAGPLSGLAAGLAALDVPAAFVCACDMPLLRLALVALLLERLPGYDLVIPERAGRLEPLCAVYARSALPVVRRRLHDDQLRLSALADDLRTCRVPASDWQRVDPQGESFLSVNTPADLAALRARGVPLEPPEDLLIRDADAG